MIKSSLLGDGVARIFGVASKLQSLGSSEVNRGVDLSDATSVSSILDGLLSLQGLRGRLLGDLLGTRFLLLGLGGLFVICTNNNYYLPTIFKSNNW